ncbi:Uncharacterised protein [Starkeya nomas]|uniref:SCP domain-containing protein n=1 Tax=Starkeya nomas TaxID=2666134 RepID=A0A5S9PNI8_9HYPH|nr:hypothetical protein [Starkeya nomas]CAA0105850.1 Uncharacterised protein [Starkeya nomas]
MMDHSKIIALVALGTALAIPLATPITAHAQTQYAPPTFPWLRQHTAATGPINQAALNGDAAIRWQSTINSYARGH